MLGGCQFAKRERLSTRVLSVFASPFIFWFVDSSRESLSCRPSVWGQTVDKSGYLHLVPLTNAGDKKAHYDTNGGPPKQVGEIMEAEEDPAESDEKCPRK
jgi:hypothetical protein